MNDPMRVLKMLFENETSFLSELGPDSQRIIQVIRHMILIELEHLLENWTDTDSSTLRDTVYANAVQMTKRELERDAATHENLVDEIAREYEREALFAIDAVLERIQGAEKFKQNS